MAALFADVGPEPQELAVDPVQDGLEVLTLPGSSLSNSSRSCGSQDQGLGKRPSQATPIYPPCPHKRATPAPLIPPSLGSPLHHQDKLLIHISLGHRAGSLGSPRNAGKTHIPAGGGDRRHGEFRNCLPLHPALWPSANSPGSQGPLPPPRVSSETHIPVFPSPPT